MTIEKYDKEIVRYALSILTHVLILLIIVFLQKDYSAGGGGFIQVAAGGAFSSGSPAGAAKEKSAKAIKSAKAEAKDPLKTKESESDKIDNGKNTKNGNDSKLDNNQNNPGNGANFYGYSAAAGDTNGLNQTYKEGSLNVSMRYPQGWTYIDQNVKNKLDGVTFWFNAGDINPPPYINLEVKEKYLFNEKSFKNHFEMNGNIMYYNDPTEMSGQVSQIIYVRTNSDEDYSIKLIINGWDAFKAFQQTFYGIVKTFKFGKSWWQ